MKVLSLQALWITYRRKEKLTPVAREGIVKNQRLLLRENCVETLCVE